MLDLLMEACEDDINLCMELVEEEVVAGRRVYPSPFKVDIFQSLSYFESPEDVKVVILGQDPYPGSHATGLAFGVPTTTKPIPGSLKNIFREVEREYGEGLHHDPTLVSWAEQGVLLLNTYLTVGDTPMSHRHIPWDKITRRVLEACAKVEGMVFVAWGREAQRTLGEVADMHRHYILYSSHPSPLSCNKGARPFVGCDHFDMINSSLEEEGHDPIVWAEEG